MLQQLTSYHFLFYKIEHSRLSKADGFIIINSVEVK